MVAKMEPTSVLEATRSPGSPRAAFGLLEGSWRALGELRSRKKSALDSLLGAPRRISRQFSTILGAKRLPKRTPGGSKMGSQIGSRLKMAKSQKLQYLSHENLGFEGPGPSKTGPKRARKWFRVSSSTRKPSKNLLRPSRSALGDSWSRKK